MEGDRLICGSNRVPLHPPLLSPERTLKPTLRQEDQNFVARSRTFSFLPDGEKTQSWGALTVRLTPASELVIKLLVRLLLLRELGLHGFEHL